MKLTPLLLLLVGLCTAVGARANYSHREPFTRSSPFEAGGTLRLSNVNGDVEIRAWDKNEILVEGEKSAATEEELKQIELTIDLSPSTAAIKVHLPKRHGGWFGGSIRANVRFVISLPASARLEKVETVNSSVHIEGVHGPINASSVNGSVVARGVEANATLHTVNGQIDAQVEKIAAGQSLSFRTVNGGVHARVPREAGLQVHCSTVNGGIDCDLPLQAGSRHHSRSLTGTVGDGRGSLDVQTVNGGIQLQSS